jgi:hypothetical protein
MVSLVTPRAEIRLWGSGGKEILLIQPGLVDRLPETASVGVAVCLQIVRRSSRHIRLKRAVVNQGPAMLGFSLNPESTCKRHGWRRDA